MWTLITRSMSTVCMPVQKNKKKPWINIGLKLFGVMDRPLDKTASYHFDTSCSRNSESNRAIIATANSLLLSMFPGADLGFLEW